MKDSLMDGQNRKSMDLRCPVPGENLGKSKLRSVKSNSYSEDENWQFEARDNVQYEWKNTPTIHATAA